MKKKRKDVFIEVPTATMTIVGFAPDVYVTVRAVLYTRMYEVAKEHKDLAKKYHAGMDRNAEIKESMISSTGGFFKCLNIKGDTRGKSGT